MTSIIVATLDTDHYTFEAYGSTMEKAKATLIAGLRRHAGLVKINAREFVERYEEDIHVRQVKLGFSYRDGNQII